VLTYRFPRDVAGFGSMLNDMQISPDGSYIVIVDTSIVAYTPAIILYDVRRGTSYRALSGFSALYGDSALMNLVTSRLTTPKRNISASNDFSLSTVHVPNLGPLGLKIHADSLALSPDSQWLLVGALTGNRLLVVPMHVLLKHTLLRRGPSGALNAEANRDIEKHVLTVRIHSAVGSAGSTTVKPITDGLICGVDKNNDSYVWFTACEEGAVGVWKLPRNKRSVVSGETAVHMRKVAQDVSLLRWPDGFSWSGAGGRGDLFVTNSALHFKFQHHGQTGTPEGMQRVVAAYAPYHILKLSAGVIENRAYASSD
jgi:WD40 repeat protein